MCLSVSMTLASLSCYVLSGLFRSAHSSAGPRSLLDSLLSDPAPSPSPTTPSSSTSSPASGSSAASPATAATTGPSSSSSSSSSSSAAGSSGPGAPSLASLSAWFASVILQGSLKVRILSFPAQDVGFFLLLNFLLLGVFSPVQAPCLFAS
jgi:hypothetical protein